MRTVTFNFILRWWPYFHCISDVVWEKERKRYRKNSCKSNQVQNTYKWSNAKGHQRQWTEKESRGRRKMKGENEIKRVKEQFSSVWERAKKRVNRGRNHSILITHGHHHHPHWDMGEGRWERKEGRNERKGESYSVWVREKERELKRREERRKNERLTPMTEGAVLFSSCGCGCGSHDA